MMIDDDLVIVSDVKCCARCGQDHKALHFDKLTKPGNILGVEFTHWASCPKSGEPVIMAITDDAQIANDHDCKIRRR